MEDSAGVAILVVDDSEPNRALVEDTLEQEGYRALLASSGEQALDIFEREEVGCVLLDVRMPGMSGFDVCRRIRALPKGADLPILFLTAVRDVDSFDEALSAGGDDFLTKPLRPAELVVRIRTALELRRLNAENRGCFDTIREQRDAMTRLQLQKEKLTAFLVHDLKTPVSTLDLHAQLLLRDTSLSPKAQASARAIRVEAKRLIQLITDMLDISKGEAGELSAKREPIVIEELLKELAREFAVKAGSRQIDLKFDVSLGTIRADPSLLRRVLQNLLDNALRHTPSGSVVMVSGGRVGASFELRVKDAGPGIPADKREVIFERFVQVGDGQQGHNVGLGLAFCQLAAAAHGGRIWVEDAAPGAVFCLRFPDDE